MLATCYTLSKKKRTSFGDCLKGVKVPQYYYLDVKSVVCMNDLINLIGLKSHNYHVLMQQLLLVIIFITSPKNVKRIITWLCSFNFFFQFNIVKLLSLNSWITRTDISRVNIVQKKTSIIEIYIHFKGTQ